MVSVSLQQDNDNYLLNYKMWRENAQHSTSQEAVKITEENMSADTIF